MANPNIAEAGRATRFKKGHARPGPGRPKTRIIREYARKIVEEKDPTGKKIIAQELVEVLLKYARKGSLGHLQQFIQLVESDASGTGWPASRQFDSDGVNQLIEKLLR
jgi:hypothetical protein